jgi:hypothetical protein
MLSLQTRTLQFQVLVCTFFFSQLFYFAAFHYVY